MKKTILKNGLTIIHKPTKGKVTALLASVHVGSNNETPKQAGLSHFLEHMIFEGTKTRTAQEIAEAIEKVGGEFNAYTNNERTVFYVKIPNKFFDTGLEIISDIILNSKFEQRWFNKEKKVVLEEINMTNDQPLHYQWILFEKSLFEKINAKNPVYGNKKAVKAITRQQMMAYYKKYYVPNNMVVAVVGDVKNATKKVKVRVEQAKKKQLTKQKKQKEPKQTRIKLIREKKKNVQSYAVFGYKTVPRLHKDSYALDIIKAIFAKGLSGRIVDEIRIKRGLAYQASCHHEAMMDYGFFAIYFNTNKKSLERCRNIVIDEIHKLQDISPRELKEAKDHIEGHEIVKTEDPEKLGDELTFWEHVKDAKLTESYIKTIRKTTIADVKRVAKKYLNSFYTMTVVD